MVINGYFFPCEQKVIIWKDVISEKSADQGKTVHSSICHGFLHGDLQLFLICTFIMRSLQVRKNCYSGPPTPSNLLPGRAHILLLSPYGLWSRINCRSESKCQGCSPMLMANRRIRTIWRAQNPQFFCHTPGEKWGLWLESWITEPQIRLQHYRTSIRPFWTRKLHKVRGHWRMTSSDIGFGV